MGNWCFGSKKDYDDDFLDEEEGEDGVVVVSKRYTYANHRKTRFEHRRETDDPASDSDENIRRLAAEMQGDTTRKGKRRSKKYEQNNSMLLDLLEGKKKKGFFSRKLAKLRGKNKKKDEDKVEKKTKKDKKKEAKEMEKAKAKNKAATKQAMREAMGEVPKQGEDVNIRESSTIKRKERRESVADKMLTKQLSKYKERFGFKKSAPMEYSPEL